MTVFYEYKCEECDMRYTQPYLIGKAPSVDAHPLCGCRCKGVRVYSQPLVRYEGGRDEFLYGRSNKEERRWQRKAAIAAGHNPEALTHTAPVGGD